METGPRTRSLARPLAALAFALAYSQAPLYTSNQNQYFLHGAAAAGVGLLRLDWLANTQDPTPLFSLLVRLTFQFLHPMFFYLYALLLLGLYFHSLIGIAGEAFPETRKGQARQLLMVGLVFTHAAALRALLTRALGPSWAYLFDGGVAGQRLLGAVLQPSTFGVFLLLSVLLYVRRRPYAALLAAVLAASVHPTYLLSAAVLVLVYGGHSFRDRRLGAPLGMGALALLLVLPITVHTWLLFRPTSAQLAAQARQVLVSVRIPHHALVAEWLDLSVAFKGLWVLGGLWLARRQRRLFALMLALLGVGLSLTLVQVLTGSEALALLFPWRLSTLLVPLASALWCAAGASWSARRLGGPPRRAWLGAGAWALVTLLALAGVADFGLAWRAKRAHPARPAMAYVAEHKAPGQVYLIPLRLQDFRLVSGAPAYVDFKAIPYRDVEVLEWFRRQRMAGWFYRDRVEEVDCELLPRFALEGVTHILLPAHLFDLACPGLQVLYQDAHYRVLGLRGW